jgi:hypothetical protein
VTRLADKPAGQPSAAAPSLPAQGQSAVTVQPGDESLKFILPADLKPGVFAYSLSGAGGQAKGLLNAPVVWWAQGDQGTSARPGGWVGAFGRNLAGNGTTGYLTGPRALTLKPTEADAWSARFKLPKDLPAGQYQLHVHNGWARRSRRL